MKRSTPIWARFLPLIAALTGFIAINYRMLPPSMPVIVALAVTAVVAQMFAELIGEVRKVWSVAASLQGGYAAALIYVFITEPYNLNVPIEIGQISLLLIWLYARPGPWPTVIICLFHALAAANVAFILLPASQYAPVRTLIVVHTLFRIAVIILMVLAFVRFRSEKEERFRLTTAEVFD